MVFGILIFLKNSIGMNFGILIFITWINIGGIQCIFYTLSILIINCTIYDDDEGAKRSAQVSGGELMNYNIINTQLLYSTDVYI